jgi:hypothetical protein
MIMLKSVKRAGDFFMAARSLIHECAIITACITLFMSGFEVTQLQLTVFFHRSPPTLFCWTVLAHPLSRRSEEAFPPAEAHCGRQKIPQGRNDFL